MDIFILLSFLVVTYREDGRLTGLERGRMHQRKLPKRRKQED